MPDSQKVLSSMSNVIILSLVEHPLPHKGNSSAVVYKHTDLYVTDICDPLPVTHHHTEPRLGLVSLLPPIPYFFPLSFSCLLLLLTVSHP